MREEGFSMITAGNWEGLFNTALSNLLKKRQVLSGSSPASSSPHLKICHRFQNKSTSGLTTIKLRQV
jgi:hypothetical protein